MSVPSGYYTSKYSGEEIDALLDEMTASGPGYLSAKADKKIPSAPGNLATLDAEGNLGDSGKNPGNFAPSGWGYGGALPQIIVTNETDGTVLETALDTFMETMPDLAAKQIRFMDSPYLVDYQMVGTLFKHSSGYCSLLGHAPNGSIVHKCKNADTGGWKPFEWINPPMRLGVEYRTTERYMGKPVYTKLIQAGVVVEGTNTINHNISHPMVRTEVKINTVALPYLPYGLTSTTEYATYASTATNLYVHVKGALVGGTATAQMWYVKE